MDFLVIVLLVVGALLVMRANNRKRLAQQEQQHMISDQLIVVTQAADEDVTALGEHLQQLDIELSGRELDEATRSDYRRALDAYDDAKQSLQAVTAVEEIRNVTEILEDARYAIACVRARVNGESLPQRRSPCFFDPQHGPSVRDVRWSPLGGAPRDVPACALDAERVEVGAEPHTRKVMLGSRRVPYWEAGPAYAPWAIGYFAAFDVMNLMFMGTMMGTIWGDDFGGSPDAGTDDGDSGDGGVDGGSDAGGVDGGFDGGGSDFGDFDGGGFDGGF